METKANYVAVGAFVLILVLGGVIALLWLAGAQYSEEYAYYRTYFTGSVTGLGEGTAVRYNGIQVGRVSKLTFDPNDPKRVVVNLQINPELHIPDDSVASIASEGLTGGSYVEIDGGSKGRPTLKPSMFGAPPVINSKPSTLQELEQSAPQLVAKLNGIADRLNNVLSPQNQAAITHTLANLDSMTTAIARHDKDIETTLTNVSSATGKLDTDLSDLHVTLTNANGAVTKVGRLADDADAAVNGADIGQLSDQLRSLAASLTRLSNQFSHEPTRLIYGDRRKGYTPP
ncbi:MAG TPA: MlaD family protein [Rhizomicrobium sp.]|nr:MlaD family protein [Rhizomicrobium sp.]